MKTLVIHHHNSYHKFEEIYKTYFFEIDNDTIKLYNRDPHTGEERLHAAFRQWDYFLIEEEI